MNKIKKGLLLILMGIQLFFFSVTGEITLAEENRGWPNCPAIQAGSALVMDLNTGTVLVEHNGTEKAYPASITKIMTALIALEEAKNLDEKVVFTREAIEVNAKESTSIGMTPGEELTLRECLYALMLASANEVANAIAIHTSGSLEDFVDRMNERALELGCVNTHFNNPHGLNDPEHYTCAYDMALIGREAIKNEDFKMIAGTRAYVLPETNLMKEKRPVANHHQMINPAKLPKYAYEHCYAGKTGYTNDAKFTLVSFAKKGSMNLVCVIMKAGTREAQYGSTIKLFDYSFKRFRMEQPEKVKLNYEDDDFYQLLRGKNGVVKMGTPATAMIVVPKRCDINKVESKITYKEIDTILVGENEVGMVDYIYRGKKIGSYPLIYRSGEEFSIKSEEKAEKEEEVDAEKGEISEEKEKKLKIYQISTLVGGVIILLSVAGFFFYTGSKYRRKRFYIHRSLRGRRNRRNRFR